MKTWLKLIALFPGFMGLGHAEVDMGATTCNPPAINNIDVKYLNKNPDPWDMHSYGMSYGTGTVKGNFTAAGSGSFFVPPNGSGAINYQSCNSLSGTPAHLQLMSKIGSCNEPDPPREPQAQQCAGINTAAPFYDPNQCVTDDLGVGRGDGYGGFIDSWQGNTQIQVRIPTATWAFNGKTVHFDPASMGGPFYMMSMAALQEFMYVDMQFMLALGGSLTGAGLADATGSVYASPPNVGTGTVSYGSFIVTEQTATSRLMYDYPKYFDPQLKTMNELVSTGGTGPTQANSPQHINSGFMAALNLWWLFDGLKAAQDLCFKQFLKNSVDKSAGLKLMLGGYTIGPDLINTPTSPMDDYATHVLPGPAHPPVLTQPDVTNQMKKFPWGAPANGQPASPDYDTQNYITKVFAGLNALTAAGRSCAGGAVYDAGITLTQIQQLFFGEGGAVAKQGYGGLLWHFPISPAERQGLWTDLICAFNSLKGKAPGRSGSEISFRYDFLTLLRVARLHFAGFVNKYNDRPTPASAYSSPFSIWVRNHSMKPCTEATVQDAEWPSMSLADAPGKNEKVEKLVTDNVGIKAREYSLDLNWRTWVPTDANFAVPQTIAQGQRLWYRATDSCGNSTIEEVKWKDAPPKVATPVANPPGGTFIGSINVVLSSSTPSAIILFTVDGSTPDTVVGGATQRYTGTITISQTTTIKARAVLPGFIPSDVMSETYRKADKVATPVANPPSSQFSSNANLTVSLSTATAGATIHYTLDGSTPGEVAGGSTLVYTGTIVLSQTTTIKAIAIKAGMEKSDVMTEVYTKVSRVAKPVANPPGHQFSALTPGPSVALSSATAGAKILYTIDGSNPDTVAGGSTLVYTGPILITQNTTLKARAVLAGLEPSDIMTEVYVKFEPGKVAKPVATPPGQNFFQSISVSLKTTTDSATILFTTDGSTPAATAGGATRAYTGPLTFTQTTTLKAIAVKAGMYPSDVMTEIYTSLPPVTVKSAWYQDLDGDGRIETAVVNFSADLSTPPDALEFEITDQKLESKKLTPKKSTGEINFAPGSKSQVVVKFSPTFPFGMTSVNNRATSGKLLAQKDLPSVEAPFPVDDSVAPVIIKAKVTEPDSLQPIKRITLTYSETVETPGNIQQLSVFKRGTVEFATTRVLINRVQPGGIRENVFIIDEATEINPVFGDSVAINTDGGTFDALKNAPERKFFVFLDGIKPKARPMQVYVTFPNGLQNQAASGAVTTTPDHVYFIPVDRNGIGLSGSEPGKCPGCPGKENGKYVGPVIHVMTPGPMKYEFKIFSSLGEFMAKGSGEITEADLAQLVRKSTPAGVNYDLEIVWTGRTAVGRKAGTGAYVLSADLKTGPINGAPAGSLSRKIVFGLLRSFGAL